MTTWPWQLPTSDAVLAKQKRRAIGRANKKAGVISERIVANRLNTLGLLCVERRETGWRVKRRGGQIIGARPMAKVSGDFSAVAPGGWYVHVEAKFHGEPDARLSLSDFDTHQIEALDLYAKLAIALVAWASPHGVAIMRWPIAGFAKGAPLPWIGAEMLAITSAPTLTQGS